MIQVKVPISADPISGNTRECVMKKLTFEQDLEMVLEVEINELNNGGISFYELAKTKEGLTEAQRNVAMSKYFPSPVSPFSTRNSKVNSKTGKTDINGDVKERDALFAVTFSQLKAMTNSTDSDSVLKSFFKVVVSKMQEINESGRS